MDPAQVDHLLHPMIDPQATVHVLGKGLPASPGAASGRSSSTAEEAVRRRESGGRVLLVRNETSPEDIRGMYAAEGILTARGGMTSHAAVVARGMGKCCVVGCGSCRSMKGQDIAASALRKSMPGIISPLTAQPGRSCGDKRR